MADVDRTDCVPFSCCARCCTTTNLRFRRYHRRETKDIILRTLLTELFNSYDKSMMETINERKLARITLHIGKSIKSKYTNYEKNSVINSHIRLISDEDTKKSPYVMFILYCIHFSFLYKTTNKSQVNETNIKDSIDNLITIYGGKVDIGEDILREVAKIIVNCNQLYYRPEKSTLIEDLDRLLDNETIQGIPILHMLLSSIKITLTHNKISIR